MSSIAAYPSRTVPRTMSVIPATARTLSVNQGFTRHRLPVRTRSLVAEARRTGQGPADAGSASASLILPGRDGQGSQHLAEGVTKGGCPEPGGQACGDVEDGEQPGPVLAQADGL